MKKLILLSIITISLAGCSNPYLNPQRAKSVSEVEQVELLKQQVELQKEQNVQLKRIADALEKK